MSVSSNNKKSSRVYIESVHEGIKYSCEQCEYQATRKESLDKHRRSVHDWIKYPCGQFEYQVCKNPLDFLIDQSKCMKCVILLID